MSSDVAELVRDAHVFPDGWRKAPFSALADYVNGRAFKPDDWGTVGLPIIRIAQITNPDAETNFYDGEVDPRNLIDDDDLIFSWSATLAVMRWRKGPAVLNQHLFKVTPAKGIDRDWLQFRLEASIPDLADEAHGTTMKHIRKGTLSSQCTIVPPLDEQRRIAEVLRSVDEAIAAAASVVGQADEAFEAVLADLFSRYGDASTKLESYCLTGGLQTGPFGSQLKAEDYVGDGIPVIMPVDLTPNGMNFVGANKAPVSKSRELARHLLQPGDVLFARRGEIGRCGLYLEGDPVALCGTGSLRARLDATKIDPALAYFLIQSRQARDWLCAHAVGATMPNLNTTIIGELPMPDIPVDEQCHWVDALLMIEGTRRINRSSLTSYQNAKADLMSDLLSGRVRVPCGDAVNMRVKNHED